MQLRKILKEILLTESNNKSYAKFGLSTVDVFSLVNFSDNYRNLYPGYENDEYQNEYEDEYYFESEEVAYSEVNSVLDMFDNLPDPIPLYRTIYAKNKSDIDLEFLGDSWSFEKDSALKFGENHARANYLLSGFVRANRVRWKDTIKLYFINSYGDPSEAEDEITVDGHRGYVTDITITKINYINVQLFHKVINNLMFITC